MILCFFGLWEKQKFERRRFFPRGGKWKFARVARKKRYRIAHDVESITILWNAKRISAGGDERSSNAPTISTLTAAAAATATISSEARHEWTILAAAVRPTPSSSHSSPPEWTASNDGSKGSATTGIQYSAATAEQSGGESGFEWQQCHVVADIVPSTS